MTTFCIVNPLSTMYCWRKAGVYNTTSRVTKPITLAQRIFICIITYNVLFKTIKSLYLKCASLFSHAIYQLLIRCDTFDTSFEKLVPEKISFFQIMKVLLHHPLFRCQISSIPTHALKVWISG